MRRFLLLAICMAGFVTSSAVAEREQTLAGAALEDACRLSVFVCDGVETPRILWLPLSGGLQGAYFPGTNVVIMNSALLRNPSLRAYGILVHEMTHYLQNENGRMETETACEIEAYAFAIYNLLMEENGRPDLRRNHWRQLYGCE